MQREKRVLMRNNKRDIAVGDFVKSITGQKDKFVKKLLKEYENGEGFKEQCLNNLFDKPKSGIQYDAPTILTQVTCLNVFFSAGLNTNPSTKIHDRKIAADLQTMANHIHKCFNKKQLMKLISEGSPDAVKQIRALPDNENPDFKDAYSFATKYCSWLNPEDFPIADRYSKGMVYYLLKNKEFQAANDKAVEARTQAQLLEYGEFKSSFNSVKSWVNETCGQRYTTKEIDELLWLYAKNRSKEVRLYFD